MIVFVGELQPGSTCRMRAETLNRMGVATQWVDTNALAKLHSGTTLLAKAAQRYVPLRTRASRAIGAMILDKVRESRPKLLWVDKGLLVSPAVLAKVRKLYGVATVHYNPDDPFGEFRRGWSGFLRALPEYDVHFVPRLGNVAEYEARGARTVFTFDRGFDPMVHRPVSLSAEDRSKYAAPVGLVASYAAKRSQSVAHLLRSNVGVSVRGNDWSRAEDWKTIEPYWRGPSVYGDEYAKAICGLDIALHFVRHENRDQQDSRTFEIPACGVFMLAESTPKHLELFDDGKEAVFFDSDEELKEKVLYYSSHAAERKRIAEAGYARCYRSGYSYEQRLKGLLAKVAEATGVRVN